MAVIQVDVDETLLETVGIQAVKAFMERQLSLLRVRQLGGKIAAAVGQSGFDHRTEVEHARQEAWEELRGKHLEDL